MRSAQADGRASRWFLLALGALLLGCPTLLATRDPVVLLAWLALAAAPIGVALGGAGLPAWPWSAMVPAGWMIAFAACGAASGRSLPTPHWAALGWCGLFAFGWGLGRLAPAARATTAALLACALVVLAGAPLGFGLVPGAFSPALTARLLDLSPVTALVEMAGVDFMRHPLLYEGARTLDIGPELRGPIRGVLAGPLWLLVGCATLGIALRRGPRPTDPARGA
jgi:hypothetical protein